jgi:hypothetical protein
MPKPRCSICRHPQLTEINAALKGGTSVRKAAARFGLSTAAIGRHRLEDERAKTRVNIGDLAHIDEEIQKLKRAQNRAKRKRDGSLVLQIAKELRNWFVLRSRAEVAEIGVASAANKEDQLTPGEALALARSVVESQLGEPEVRAWVLALAERLRTPGNVPDGQE